MNQSSAVFLADANSPATHAVIIGVNGEWRLSAGIPDPSNQHAVITFTPKSNGADLTLVGDLHDLMRLFGRAQEILADLDPRNLSPEALRETHSHAEADYLAHRFNHVD